jgi:hypothetical protein
MKTYSIALSMFGPCLVWLGFRACAVTYGARSFAQQDKKPYPLSHGSLSKNNGNKIASCKSNGWS